MKLYFGLEMREFTLNPIASIDILIDCLKEIQRDKYSIDIPHKRVVRFVESRMGSFVSERLRIEGSRLEISLVVLSKYLKHPDKCRLVCSGHIVGDSLEFAMRFESWMFEEIPVNRSNLVRLADLYGDMKDVINNGFYSVSSINHGEARRVSRCLESPKHCAVVFEGFLEDVF